MEFNEIKKINRMPFDENWLSEFCYTGMHYAPGASYLLNIYLLHWYFVKFNETYGTDIVVMDSPNLNLSEVPNKCFDSENVTDAYMEYEYGCAELFGEMALIAGFEVLHIPLRDDVFNEEMWKATKRIRKKYFKNEFKEHAPSWEALLWKNFNNIKESDFYLEDGEAYLLRNEDMGRFFQFCEKYEDVVKAHLSEESRLIREVIGELMKPLYYENVREEGRIGKYQYLYFDMGSNGYEYLGFSTLNLNWVVNCYVFPLLIHDFTEKVQQLFDIYPELRNRL